MRLPKFPERSCKKLIAQKLTTFIDIYPDAILSITRKRNFNSHSVNSGERPNILKRSEGGPKENEEVNFSFQTLEEGS